MKERMSIVKKFDKKIKKLSKDINIPATYDEKLDKVLQTIEEKEPVPEKKQSGKKFILAAVCLIGIICIVTFAGTLSSEANIVDYLKGVIQNFLGMDADKKEEIGADSKSMSVGSQADLMMEIQEAVMDTHAIYLLVKITAPTDIKLTEEIGFDYYCFCKGENYNNNQLIPGVRELHLLEVNPKKPNVGTYIVKQMLEEPLEEEESVTVSFKDMMRNPYSENPELLVEGMWSLTFPFYLTVTNNLTVEGTPDMTFSYIDTTASVRSIELTPTGLIVETDISNYPLDGRGVVDTSIAFRLKMIDGTEQLLVGHDLEFGPLVRTADRSFEDDVIEGTLETNFSYQKDVIEFEGVQNISLIAGIYIEDLYVPFD